MRVCACVSVHVCVCMCVSKSDLACVPGQCLEAVTSRAFHFDEVSGRKSLIMQEQIDHSQNTVSPTGVFCSICLSMDSGIQIMLLRDAARNVEVCGRLLL